MKVDTQLILRAITFVKACSDLPSVDKPVMKIDITTKGIILSTSDLNIFCRATIPFDGGDPITIVSNPLPIIAFLAATSNKQVNIQITNKDIKLSSDSGSAQVRTSDTTIFPEWTHDQIKLLGGKDLGNFIIKEAKRIALCSSSMITPILYNVHLSCSPKRSFVEAADGYRYGKISTSAQAADTVDLLIPIKSVLKMPIMEAKVGICKSSLYFAQKHKDLTLEVWVRTSFGEYPKIVDIISKRAKEKINILVNGDAVDKLLSVCLAYTDDDYHNVLLSAADSKLSLIASGQNSYRSSVDAKVTGNGQILLDAKHIIDYIKTSSGKVVEFSIASAEDPVFISSEDKNFVYVIWPLKKRNETE